MGYGRLKERGLEKASHQEKRNLFSKPCMQGGAFPASSKSSLSCFPCSLLLPLDFFWCSPGPYSGEVCLQKFSCFQSPLVLRQLSSPPGVTYPQRVLCNCGFCDVVYLRITQKALGNAEHRGYSQSFWFRSSSLESDSNPGGLCTHP